MRVAVYRIAGHRRSNVVCDALMRGIVAAGDEAVSRDEASYAGVDADCCAFYGLENRTPTLFADYARERKAVYVDLGYFGRRMGGRFTGFHKLCVNDRHPTAYFQARKHDHSRARALSVRAQPWKAGRHVVVAGMSDKGARAEGFAPEQWERETIAEIRKHTDRPIVYRPKPSWKGARPIEGCGYSIREDVEAALKGAHCVVSHHSNVNVDALLEGVPSFTWKGVAEPMSLQDLARIEKPWRPDDREQWAADICWTQFSIAEIAAGVAWRHLRTEGIL